MIGSLVMFDITTIDNENKHQTLTCEVGLCILINCIYLQQINLELKFS